MNRVTIISLYECSWWFKGENNMKTWRNCLQIDPEGFSYFCLLHRLTSGLKFYTPSPQKKKKKKKILLASPKNTGQFCHFPQNTKTIHCNQWYWQKKKATEVFSLYNTIIDSRSFLALIVKNATFYSWIHYNVPYFENWHLTMAYPNK